ncbi:CGGC domain-containing protein [Clostridium amazonitimonense]|uniref:CGGC domain-containing protein n=1 Tax=Clostridium amazonitimonense TaxID=1499689 RepID=UPI00050950B0|nr:CGGC domain-containing protein [Clostridium amazonitimonense]
MKIGIIVNEDTANRCTGKGCLDAFYKTKDSFERYKDVEDIELMAFTHDGGDINRKIEKMISNGVEVVHLSSCMRGSSDNYEKLADILSEHFEVVGYTHGSKEGKKNNTINLDKKTV